MAERRIPVAHITQEQTVAGIVALVLLHKEWQCTQGLTDETFDSLLEAYSASASFTASRRLVEYASYRWQGEGEADALVLADIHVATQPMMVMPA